MPLPSFLADAALVGAGGLLAEVVRAIRSRGEHKSKEKVSLQQGEAEFRTMLLAQNSKQQEEIDKLREAIEALRTKHQNDLDEAKASAAACEERNERLEERIAELEATVERRQTPRTATPAPFPPVEIEKVPH